MARLFLFECLTVFLCVLFEYYFFASLSYKFMQTSVYGKNLMCERVHGCLNLN